jgi:hypothetical protein
MGVKEHWSKEVALIFYEGEEGSGIRLRHERDGM